MNGNRFESGTGKTYARTCEGHRLRADLAKRLEAQVGDMALNGENFEVLGMKRPFRGPIRTDSEADDDSGYGGSSLATSAVVWEPEVDPKTLPALSSRK